MDDQQRTLRDLLPLNPIRGAGPVQKPSGVSVATKMATDAVKKKAKKDIKKNIVTNAGM